MKFYLHMLLVSLLAVYCSGRTVDSSSSGKNKVIIRVGSDSGMVEWADFDSYGISRKTVSNFIIGNHGQFYIGSYVGPTLMLKRFDSCGHYLNTIDMHDVSFIALDDTIFYGHYSCSKCENKLIIFSGYGGALLREIIIPFESPHSWAAYSLRARRVYFSCFGQQPKADKFYDIDQNTFKDDDGRDSLDSDCQKQAIKKYCSGFSGGQFVGNGNGYMFYLSQNYKAEPRYDFVAVNVDCKNTDTLHLRLNAKDIGAKMPDVPWVYHASGFLYAIGYPEKKGKALPEIWITKLDLKKLFPGIFAGDKNK